MKKDIDFGCIWEFADYIAERVEDNEELYLTVVGKFEGIKEIIKEIMANGNVDFDTLNIISPDISGYSDDYILDCWCLDGIIQIGCKPVKQNDVYMDFTGDETYLLPDCGSKIISLCDNTRLYFVNIDDDDEYDEYDECCECDNCCGCCKNDDVYIECSSGKDGNTHGFTASKRKDDGYYSFSYYTNDELEEMDIYSMLKQFGF